MSKNPIEIKFQQKIKGSILHYSKIFFVIFFKVFVESLNFIASARLYIYISKHSFVILLFFFIISDGLGLVKAAKRKKDSTEKLPHILSQSANLSLMSPHHQDLGGGALSDGGHSSDNTDCEKKKKKARTTFTGRQIFELEKQFENKKYLSSSERSEMAKLLQVTETQVRSH